MIAIIPKHIAKPGNKFHFIGLVKECDKCSLKNVCKNLRVNKIYVIKNVREKTFNCLISGISNVCEVEESSFETIIDRRKAIEGASITIDKELCKNFSCRFFYLCNNILRGAFLVEKVLENIECEKGFNLVKVLLK